MTGRHSQRKGRRAGGKAPRQRGDYAERKAVTYFRDDGWLVFRSAGSFGLYDVIAIRGDEIRLIQVKRSANTKYINPPRELRKLEATEPKADRLRVKKQIWTWVDRDTWHVADA